MALAQQELADAIKSGAVDTVILGGIDLQGRLFGKRIPAREYLSRTKGKIHTCAVNLSWDIVQNIMLTPFCNLESGIQDMKLIADEGTIRKAAWLEKTALILGDLYEENSEPVALSPRHILRTQQERLAAMGYTALTATELEFYLYRENTDSLRQKGWVGLQTISPFHQDYSVLRSTMDEWFLGPARRNMEASGLPVECVKGEHGFGQYEWNVPPAAPLEMADRHALTKHALREMAALNGLTACFMAKPDTSLAPSSTHVHFSLWRDGKNVFWDPAAEGGLSEIGRSFVGGLLALMKGLQYFHAPYINSYRRYAFVGEPTGAPVTVTWGWDNRTTTVRVVGHEESFRLEFRLPGADAVAHLSLAAILASGIWGIDNKIDPGKPFIGNGLTSLDRVADNMADAIRALQACEPAAKLLGREVIDHLLLMARQETEQFSVVVTDWERARYMEMA